MEDILFKGKSISTGITVYGTPVKSVNDRVYLIHGATEDAVNTTNNVDFIYTEIEPETLLCINIKKTDVRYYMDIPEINEEDTKLTNLDEKAAILKALRRCDGHRLNAAEMLGISERTLYRKLKRYRIENS